MASSGHDDVPTEINFRIKDTAQILTQRDGISTVFSIDRNLLDLASPTLAAATETDLRDGKLELLKDFGPERFNRYLNFLATGKIHGHDFMTEFIKRPYLINLAYLYYDGEKLKDDRYKDAIIDAATDHFNENPTWPEYADKLSVAKCVKFFNYMTDDHPFWRLTLDMWAKRGTDKEFEGLSRGLQPEDRARTEKELRKAFVRNRLRKMDHYDEEEKAIFKVIKPAAEHPSKRQRTQ